MAKRSKGTVGVVGLGNMGGAFARHLAAAGWRVLGFDIDEGPKSAARNAGVEIASPQALAATVAAITARALPPRIVIEASTFTLADKERAEAALRRAGHVTLDCP